MATVQAKATTMRFLFLATYQYNSAHHKASDPTCIEVGMNLLVPLIMKSQSYKHSSIHYFSTSANHIATSLTCIASVHEFTSSDNHEASNLICTAVRMYLPTSHFRDV
jgi:hypothetical protein